MAVSTGVERYCPTCGEDRVSDAQGRCSSCGRLTMMGTTRAEYDRQSHLAPKSPVPIANAPVAPVSAAPPPAPKAGVVVLPDTAAARRWLEQTRALAAAFEQSSHAARTRARAVNDSASQLERAATAFAQLVNQIEIPAALKRTTPPHRTGQRLNGRWSRLHEACVKCLRTDRPHKAHGFCESCHRSTKR